MNLEAKRIGFLGAGNMAQAIIKGMLAAGVAAEAISFSCKSAATASSVTQKYGINCQMDNAKLFAENDVLVLAVKPWQVLAILQELGASATHPPLIISVIAGLSTTKIASYLGAETKIIRSMPNTPSQIKLGATGLYANENCSGADKTYAENLFAQFGINAWVTDEAMLAAITALSGSGPAYVFKFMAALANLAIAAGIDQDTANAFSIQTILGAAQLAQNSDKDFKQLIAEVTSKGGTTEAALQAFDRANFVDVISSGFTAAQTRSNEIELELDNS